ncbi:MAG: hypothetical protein CMJ28_07065 [Phycisphaerae bacterium]|nr:hypothetical protein [Phycisphaerae bacterium]
MEKSFPSGFLVEESAVGGQLTRLGLAHQAGFQNLALDATVAGRRPRELDEGARSDLRRTVCHQGLTVLAISLRIPQEHFVREDTMDRASMAALQAIGFAESLRANFVVLPAIAGETAELVFQEAERRGRRLLIDSGVGATGLVEVIGQECPEEVGGFRLVQESSRALQLPFAVYAGLRSDHGFPIFVDGKDGLASAVDRARQFASLLPEFVG